MAPIEHPVRSIVGPGHPVVPLAQRLARANDATFFAPIFRDLAEEKSSRSSARPVPSSIRDTRKMENTCGGQEPPEGGQSDEVRFGFT